MESQYPKCGGGEVHYLERIQGDRERKVVAMKVLGVGGDDHVDNSSKGNDGIDGCDRSWSFFLLAAVTT
jgi:hypothetical protein